MTAAAARPDPGRRLARAVASGGGLGRARVAPGTVASVAAALAGTALLRAGGRAALPVAASLATACGFASLARLPEAAEDPGWVVIDEIAGMWFAMSWMRRPHPVGLAASLALFRALDILKPGPIGRIDRGRGARAVMLDDVVAGMIAATVLGGLGSLPSRDRERRRR